MNHGTKPTRDEYLDWAAEQLEIPRHLWDEFWKKEQEYFNNTAETLCLRFQESSFWTDVLEGLQYEL